MMLTLIRKLLRDLRVALVVVAVLLGAFQCLWYKVTERIIGQLSPFFNTLASLGGLTNKDIQDVLFAGPGKIIRTLVGGDQLDFDGVMDMLSIGYVHPLMQTIFCIWAVGRAAGAVAGETDRGTMELLLAQPVPRHRLILAHLCVDLMTIPILCLSLWAGNCLGCWLVGPVQPRPPELPELKTREQRPAYLVEFGPFKVSVQSPVDLGARSKQPAPGSAERARRRLEVHLADFGPALPVVGGLIFAVSGYTMWLSAMGRFRWRVLGLAVLVTLLQFLVNVIGQMWDVAAPLRPFTIFYYYQPQKVILGQGWCVDFAVWNDGKPLVQVPMLLVLYGVGLAGYALALWTFTRRDIPAPL
ncbi:MAG: ABC transporter permease subunit [Planctomycetes bacterium]|nr:ABC transporter permease subunit [Planctomycetota bacterium]